MYFYTIESIGWKIPSKYFLRKVEGTHVIIFLQKSDILFQPKFVVTYSTCNCTLSQKVYFINLKVFFFIIYYKKSDNEKINKKFFLSEYKSLIKL